MSSSKKLLIIYAILGVCIGEIENKEGRTSGIELANELLSLQFVREGRDQIVGRIKEEGRTMREIESADVCLGRLEEMVTNPRTDPTMSNFVVYSGKGMIDLGDFPGCRETQLSKYILATALGYVSIGLCVPKQCSATDFTILTYTLAAQIGIPIPPGFFFIDTQHLNETRGRIGGGAGAIIVILCVLTLISILAGIYDLYILQKRDESFKLRKEIPPKKSRREEIITFFSIASNAKALIYAKNRIDPNLDIFHGVRFLSISWVILGHSFMTFLEMSVTNIQGLIKAVTEDFGFSIITAGTLSVDTFFTLSGFFSILGVWKEVGRPGGKAINIFKCYFHRYIRLLPLYAIIILISIYIMPLLVFGPINFFIDGIASTCEDKWWWNLLYINNAQPMSEQCIPWTWYLANDMQMFLLAPILVYIYCIKPMLGILSVGALALTSSIVQIVFIVKNDWVINLLSPNAAPDAYYIRPWMRINTYLVGIVCAWIYMAFKEGEKAEKEGEPKGGFMHPPTFRKLAFLLRGSPLSRYLLYFFGFALTFLAVFTIYPFLHIPITSNAPNALYIFLFRPLFVIGLMMVLFPVLLGHGRPLLATLGAPFFAPLGRMTYGVYMIHLEIFFYLAGIQEDTKYYSVHMVFFWTLRIIFLSYLVSLFLTLVLEAPLMRVEQWVLRGHFIRKKESGIKYTAIKELKDEESKLDDQLNINESEIKPKT